MDRASHAGSTLHEPGQSTPAGPRPKTAPRRACATHRAHIAGDTDTILRRAEELPFDDATLLEAYYRHGQTCREIAALCGSTPQRIWRRLKRLRLRLSSRTFVVAASPDSRLRGVQRTVARELFINGRSMRHVSQSLGLTLHEVRRHATLVRLLAEQWT